MKPLPSDTLDANRSGQLTARQRDALVQRLRSRNRSALVIAAALVAVSIVIEIAAAPYLSPVWRIAILVITLGVAASLVLRVLTGGDKALASDLRDGQVLSVSGPIGREEESAMDVNGTSIYILKVADHRFTVPKVTLDAAPRSGRVRAYYLPASRRLLNLEPLADDPTAATPRPLAEALIGSWRNHFAKAAFTPDGRVTASVMGRHSTGSWSVDAAGQLHAEIAGRAEIAQASIHGDELSINLAGRVITLAREA